MEKLNHWDATIDQIITDLDDADDMDEITLNCETVEDYIARFRSIAEAELVQ